MKKQEYIEKYGEEAWQRYLEKDRQRYFKNREKIIERKKEYLKNYRENNREKINAYFKDYYQNNKEKLSNNSKEYRSQNKDRINAQKREYTKTKTGRANSLAHTYREKDKIKLFNISNNVNGKWIVENIFSGQKCVYCGDQDWTHLGCDRIDNNKPHTPDNVVCSCFLCNLTRTDKFNVEEFKQYRALHPRACDIPKGPAIELSSTGAIKKKTVNFC